MCCGVWRWGVELLAVWVYWNSESFGYSRERVGMGDLYRSIGWVSLCCLSAILSHGDCSVVSEDCNSRISIVAEDR